MMMMVMTMMMMMMVMMMVMMITLITNEGMWWHKSSVRVNSDTHDINWFTLHHITVHCHDVTLHNIASHCITAIYSTQHMDSVSYRIRVIQKCPAASCRSVELNSAVQCFTTVTIIVQCNAMQCNAMQCNAMQCNAVQNCGEREGINLHLMLWPGKRQSAVFNPPSPPS